jgi:NAD dependent epimerase/dehydratase
MGAEIKIKNVVVTGSAGFIGSHLVEALVEGGFTVKALVHYNSTGNIANLDYIDKKTLSEVEIAFGDIRDEYYCEKLTKGADAVFHLAALIGIPYSYVAPASYVETNIRGTVNLLNSCLRNDIPRFVHTSTSEVYGTALYTPIDEKHPLQGQSPYSASKIAADKLVESYCRSFDVNATTIRPFNTFGPRQSLRAVVPTIVTQALQSNRISIGSTHPRRDLVFVADTVKAYLAAAGRFDLKNETINVGTGVSFSIAEMIDTVSRVLGKELLTVEEKERIRPEQSEVLNLLCDNAKAKRLLDWAPSYTFEEGIRRVVEFFQSRRVGDSHDYHV